MKTIHFCWTKTADARAGRYRTEKCRRYVLSADTSHCRVVSGRGHRRLQHAAGGRDEHGGGVGGGCSRCGGRAGGGALRRDHHTDVPGHRVQHDVDAQPAEPRDAGRGRHGSASVLATGRDQLFGGPQVFPVFRVHAHLHRRVSAATAGVPERVRTGPGRMSAGHAAVRVRVAGEDAVR